MHNNPKKYLTVKETAEILNKDESMIRRYCTDGLLPGAKKAGLSPRSHWRIPAESVEAARQQIITEE